MDRTMQQRFSLGLAKMCCFGRKKNLPEWIHMSMGCHIMFFG